MSGRVELKEDGPCDSYAGNLCGGFGGKLICWTCGWPKHMHGERAAKIAESLRRRGLAQMETEGEIDEQGQVEARTRAHELAENSWWPPGEDDERTDDERRCAEAHKPKLIGDMTVEEIARYDLPIEVVVAIWLEHEQDPQRRGAFEDVLAVLDAKRTRRLPVNWTMVVPGLQVDDRPRCKATSTHRGQQVPCQKEEGHSGLCVWFDPMGDDEAAWRRRAVSDQTRCPNTTWYFGETLSCERPLFHGGYHHHVSEHIEIQWGPVGQVTREGGR